MKNQEAVQKHYSIRLQKWIDEYENPISYPFTRIRLARILEYVKHNNVKRENILDVGCGVGIPSMEIAEPTSSIHGFDLSPELIAYASERAQQLNLTAKYVAGSATDPFAYPNQSFDLILALGVFQHIADDQTVLDQIAKHLAPDGTTILSFRNPLFALVTFNRPSYELYRELFQEFLDSNDGQVLDEFLRSKFNLDLPPLRSGGKETPHLDDIVFKYQNPLTIDELLKKSGLRKIHVDFYRHHAMPPQLEQRAPESFKTLSLTLDEQDNDWRSMFLCSTYLVYCRHSES